MTLTKGTRVLTPRGVRMTDTNKLEVPHVEIRRTSPMEAPDLDVQAVGPEAVLPLLREVLQGREQESFIMLLLDARFRVSAWHEVARGHANNVSIPVREMFRTALACDARALVISHNHPSGDPNPSPEDIVMTARLREAGNLIGLPILDHLIIGEGTRYYSFNYKGEISSMPGIPVTGAARQPPEFD